MPKLIQLNSYGSLALVLPRAVCQSLQLKKGDVFKVLTKSSDPIIIGLYRDETEDSKIKW